MSGQGADEQAVGDEAHDHWKVDHEVLGHVSEDHEDRLVAGVQGGEALRPRTTLVVCPRGGSLLFFNPFCLPLIDAVGVMCVWFIIHVCSRCKPPSSR